MTAELIITTPAPLQLGNLVTFRVQFVDEDGAAIDISSAADLEVKFESPSPVVVTAETAAFEDDGTDGWIVATFAPDKLGTWRLQGKVTMGGNPKHTARAVFTVEPNIPDPS